VVFGQVIDGMDTIFECAKVPTDMCDKPRIPVTIFDCGEVDSKARHLEEDDILGSISNMTRKERERIEKIKLLEEEELKKAEEESQPLRGVVDIDENLGGEQEPTEFKDERAKRIHEMKLKMNQARKLNNEAVVDENERMTNPNYDKKRRRREWEEQQKEYTGVTDTLSSKYKVKKRNKKKAITFGWDVFNDDAIYRAYEKRADKLQKDDIDDSHLNEEEKNKLKSERVNRLVDDIEKQRSKRDNFQRRRAHVEEKDIDYINERNKNFNKKLERNYSKYAAEIKANLERGSAI